MKTMLALLVSFSSLVALSSQVQAQSPSMSATLTESGGYVTLSISITGTECPGGWLTFFRLCGDPNWAPVPGMQWIGNNGRASAPYQPILRGACIEVAVYCPSTGTILTATVTYP